MKLAHRLKFKTARLATANNEKDKVQSFSDSIIVLVVHIDVILLLLPRKKLKSPSHTYVFSSPANWLRFIRNQFNPVNVSPAA